MCYVVTRVQNPPLENMYTKILDIVALSLEFTTDRRQADVAYRCDQQSHVGLPAFYETASPSNPPNFDNYSPERERKIASEMNIIRFEV